MSDLVIVWLWVGMIGFVMGVIVFVLVMVYFWGGFFEL